jgi:hypothetical protein
MGRYYANTAGRFASVDAGQFVLFRPSTLNRYAYTSNDPLNKTDPDGLQEDEDPTPPPPSFWGSLMTRLRKLWRPTVAESDDMKGRYVDLLKEFDRAKERVQAAKDDILDRFKNGGFGPDCDKTLAAMGTSMGALIEQMTERMSIVNGRTSTVSVTQLGFGDLVPSLPAAVGPMTVATFLELFPQQAMAELGGNRIFINPEAFLKSDPTWNSATLLHELIHNVTGKWDQQLQSDLFGLGGVSLNTGNVTQKIKDDCFK